MKVFVACEMSGIVREAFRNKGHDAYSCDLLDSEIPSKYHIKDDVLNHLDDGWDMMIGHPPCQYICRNSAYINKLKSDREQGVKEGRDFFLKLLNANIPKICIENPVPASASKLPRYSQTIQPYEYGHDNSKKTCLWLRGLPKLETTKKVELTYITTKNGHVFTRGWYELGRNSIDRSRTFTGIAEAMAEQWTNPIQTILE